CVATEARLREATTLTAGASTSVRSGAGLTLVSVAAPTAASLTPIASRPCLVMRSAMGPASASRRHATSEPLAQTSSSSPVRMSLSTAFRTASPVTFVGRSTPRSLRREAVDRMTRWVVLTSGSSIALVRRHCRHHHSPTSATQPAGQDPEARRAPGTVTLPLYSRPNASPFLIMLLLVFGKLDNGMIRDWAELRKFARSVVRLGECPNVVKKLERQRLGGARTTG